MIIPLMSKLQEDGMWDAMGCLTESMPRWCIHQLQTSALHPAPEWRTGIHWDPVPERVEAKVSNHVRTSGVIPGCDMLWHKESTIYIQKYRVIYSILFEMASVLYTSQNWQLLVDGPTLTMHMIFSNVRKIMSADPWLFGSWDVQAQASKEAQLTSSPGVG